MALSSQLFLNDCVRAPWPSKLTGHVDLDPRVNGRTEAFCPNAPLKSLRLRLSGAVSESSGC